MAQKLRIGVIGVGGRGSLAAYAHNPADNVFLAAGADISQAALDDFKKKYGPDTFVTTDYRELLNQNDIDAVFITSPDYLHEKQAIAALNAGKHVYCEKPLAITIEGCDKILAAAVNNRCKLYVGHNMRHMGVVLKMKELIDNGKIGTVKAAWCRHFISYGGDAYFKDWHADRTKSTGLLLQKGAHDIDVLHWLCKGYSTRITAMGTLSVYNQISDRHAPSVRGDPTFRGENWPPLSQKQLNPIMDVEDHSMMLMQLDNGVQASYEQCHYTPDGWRNYTFIGTEGRLENFGDFSGTAEVRLWNQRTDYKPNGDEVYPVELGSGANHGGADQKIIQEFIRYVREGGKIHTSAVAARQAVAAGFMATQSLRQGSVPLEIPNVDKNLADYFDKDVL